jgi:hypothetical protein
MSLFRKKTDIIKDSPNVSGKVIVNIDVRRQDRQTRKIKIVVVATWANETLFKAEYSSIAKNDMQAVNEAQTIAEAFCKHENYVITSIETTGADLPFVRTVDRGSRW